MGFNVNLLLQDPLIKVRFHDLTKRKVIKYNGLVKALFYFLEFERDQICVTETQKLFWKKANHLWNEELVKKMSSYNYKGAKPHEIKAYQTLNYIEKQISTLSFDDLSNYNYAMGVIYQWLKLAIEARRRDISKRIYDEKTKKDERDGKIEEEKQRVEEMKAAKEEAEAKFDDENKDAL